MEIDKFLKFLSQGCVRANDGMSRIPIAIHLIEGGEPVVQDASCVDVYVLDEQLQPVKNGQIGILHISALMQTGQPCLPVECSFPNPFGVGRIYRTRYWARRLTASLMCYYHRPRDIQFRGYRVPITEMTKAVQAFADVRSCVIYPIDNQDEHALIAYITTHQWVDLKQLKQFVELRLPKCWAPTDYYVLEELPVVRNGLMHSSQLPMPKRFNLTPRQAGNEVELILCEIIMDLLGVSQVPINHVSIDRDLFQLGLNSLQAAQLLRRVNDVFNLSLAIVVVFQCASVERLAVYIRLARQTQGAIIPLTQYKITLSQRQTQYWVMHQLFSGAGMVCSQVLRLYGHFDQEALALSVSALYSRHRILRMHVKNAQGRPKPGLTVEPEVSLQTWAIADLLPQAGGDAWEQVNEAINYGLYREQSLPFDLSTGPLLRIKLIAIDDDDHVMIVSAHKIILDDYSLDIVCHEMLDFYESFVDDGSVITLSSKIDYLDFAYWSRENSNQQAQAKQFWREYLADVRPLQLLTDHPRSIEPSLHSSRFHFEVDAELTQALVELAGKTHCTVSMVLLGAFQILLHRYSRQQRFAVGIMDTGRHQPGTEKMVGTFETEYCVCADFQGTESIDNVLQKLKRALLLCQRHLPFQHEMPRSDGIFERHPFYQVGFSMTPHAGMGYYTASLQIDALSTCYVNSSLDLSLHINDGVTLLGSLVYKDDLFDAATINRLVQHLSQILLEMTLNIQQPIRTLPMIDTLELKSIRKMLMETDQPSLIADPSTALLGDRFAAFAEKVALFGVSGVVTYAQLYQRAAAVAQYLRRYAMRDDVVIAIDVADPAHKIELMLGAHLAGVCYAVLDPCWSKTLKGRVLEALDPSIVIADSNTPASYRQTVTLQSCRQATPSALSWAKKEDQAYACVVFTFPENSIKMARIRYRQVANQVSWLQRNFALQAFDQVLLHNHSHAQVYSWDVFWPLSVGATLNLLPQTSAPAHLHPTLLCPSVLMIQDAVACAWMARSYDALQVSTVLVLQQEMTDALHHELLQAFPNAKIVTLFSVFDFGGPVGSYEVPTGGTCDVHKVGHPGDNIRYHIYDDNHCSVPIGLEGLLYVSSIPSAPSHDAENVLVKEIHGRRMRYVNTGIRARLLDNGEVERMPSNAQTAPRAQTDMLSCVLCEQVLQIVQKLLPHANLQLTEDFFLRGGNSLLACQLSYRLSKVFHIELPIRCVIEAQSLYALVAAVEKRVSALEQNATVCNDLGSEHLLTQQPSEARSAALKKGG